MRRQIKFGGVVESIDHLLTTVFEWGLVRAW